MEDEEWEDVLVASFVYPTDEVARPQTSGRLNSFKGRLRASYEAIEFADSDCKGQFYESFRSPSNFLVFLSNFWPYIRVLDSQMKSVSVDINFLRRYEFAPRMHASSDFKSVGIFHFDHDRNKCNLVVYDVEKNTLRSCLDICTRTFQIQQSKKKLRPFCSLNLHRFTGQEAFIFSDSLDYTRIDLATGEPNFLFNLRTIDNQSSLEPDSRVPQRPENLLLLAASKWKSYTMSTAKKNLSSYILTNEIRFAGNQTRVWSTKVYYSDEPIPTGGLELVREGFVATVPKSNKLREIVLIKPSSSLSQEGSGPRYLKIKDRLEDKHNGFSSDLITFNQWNPTLGGYTFGIFGSQRNSLKLWMLSREKFHTHLLPVHGFGRGWEIIQLGPGIRSAGHSANRKKVQFLISLKGTSIHNHSKVVTLLSTLDLRN